MEKTLKISLSEYESLIKNNKRKEFIRFLDEKMKEVSNLKDWEQAYFKKSVDRVKYQLIVKIKCDTCIFVENFEMVFGEQCEDLMNRASSNGWGIYNAKQICPRCMCGEQL